MSNELITSWSVAAVAILGALGLLYERYNKSRGGARVIETQEDIKAAAAKRKIQQSERDAVLAEWQNLYELGQERNSELLKQLDGKIAEFHNRLAMIQQEHLKCAVDLSAANTQIHELREQNQRQESRIAMLEKRGM